MNEQQLTLANQAVLKALRTGDPTVKLGNITSKSLPILNHVVEELLTAYQTGENQENIKKALLYIYLPLSMRDAAFRAYTKRFKTDNEARMQDTFDVIKDIVIEKIYNNLDNMIASYTKRKAGGFTNLMITSVRNALINYYRDKAMLYRDSMGNYSFMNKKLSLDKNLNSDSDETFGSYGTSDSDEASDFGIDVQDKGSITNAAEKYDEVKKLFGAAFEAIKDKVRDREWVAAYEKMINLTKPLDIAKKYPQYFMKNMTGDEKTDIMKARQNVNSAINSSVGRDSKFSRLFNQFIRNNSQFKDFDVTSEIGKKTSFIHEEDENLFEIDKKEFAKRLFEAVINKLKRLQP